MGFGVWGGRGSRAPLAARLGVGSEDDAPLGVADVEEVAVHRRAAGHEVVVLLAARRVGELLALLVDARGSRGDLARDAVVSVAAARHGEARLAVVALASDAGSGAATSASSRMSGRVRRATVTAPTAVLGLVLPASLRSGEGGLGLGVELRTGSLDVGVTLGHGGGLKSPLAVHLGALRSRELRELELLLEPPGVAPGERLGLQLGLHRAGDHEPAAVGALVEGLVALDVEGVDRRRAAAGPGLSVVEVGGLGPEPEAALECGLRQDEGLGGDDGVHAHQILAGARRSRLLLAVRIGLSQQEEPAGESLGTRALERCHFVDPRFGSVWGRCAGSYCCLLADNSTNNFQGHRSFNFFCTLKSSCSRDSLSLCAYAYVRKEALKRH